MPPLTFHHPKFDKSTTGKLDNEVVVIKDHSFRTLECGNCRFAIASEGFSSVNAHAFAIKLKTSASPISVGFTADPTGIPVHRSVFFNSFSARCKIVTTSQAADDFSKTKFTSYFTHTEDDRIARNASEIVCIVKFSEAIITSSSQQGKIEVRWIVDGIEGPFVDCTDNFPLQEKDEEQLQLYPLIVLVNPMQEAQTIPREEVSKRASLLLERIQPIIPEDTANDRSDDDTVQIERCASSNDKERIAALEKRCSESEREIKKLKATVKRLASLLEGK